VDPARAAVTVTWSSMEGETMEAQSALEVALEDTGAIIRGVGPDALTRSTPCAEWDVRDLLNHLVGQLWAFEARLAGTEPRHDAPPGGLPGTDLVGDDPAAAFDAVAGKVLEASRAQGAQERAGLACGAYTTETVVHGWDLARATDQRIPFEDDLARWCLDFVRQGLTDDNRAPAFGERRQPPPDATVVDELVAFAGRTP